MNPCALRTRNPRPLRAGTPHCSGFSLIEVLLATAILMGSVIVLSRLAGMGRTMAQKAQQLSEAQWLCEEVMNEIALGLRPPVEVRDAPLLPPAESADAAGEMAQDAEPAEDDLIRITGRSSGWVHSITQEFPADQPRLMLVTVEVALQPDDVVEPVVQFRLRRWLPAREMTANDAFSDDAFSNDAFGGGLL